MDELVKEPKSEAMRAAYWRSEILQIAYWLRGEKFGLGPDKDEVDAQLLQRFLGVDSAVGIRYLDRLVDDGYLDAVGKRYKLSETGRQEGALEFATSFENMLRPAHGECSEDCWCHSDPDEAAACAEQRAGAHKGHEH